MRRPREESYIEDPQEDPEDIQARLARLERLYPGGGTEGTVGGSPFTEALEATSVNLGVKIYQLRPEGYAGRWDGRF